MGFRKWLVLRDPTYNVFIFVDFKYYEYSSTMSPVAIFIKIQIAYSYARALYIDAD